MKNKESVYLSGKMTGLERREWWLRFKRAECQLFSLHEFDVFNPAETMIARHSWLYKIVGYRFALWYDLKKLKRCKYIFMVGYDWKESKGARLERMKAREWGLKEIFIIDHKVWVGL